MLTFGAAAGLMRPVHRYEHFGQTLLYERGSIRFGQHVQLTVDSSQFVRFSTVKSQLRFGQELFKHFACDSFKATMCGIWAIFGFTCDPHQACSDGFKKISHRGPDAWRIDYDDALKNACLGFHRLAIVDCLYGMQPMKIHRYPHFYLLCNGELYNYKQLQKQFSFPYETNCDVEVILHLYAAGGIDNVSKHIDGVFGFCLVDKTKRKVFISRDPYGVRPLFQLYNTKTGSLAVCSEAKGLIGLTGDMNAGEWKLEPFKPATFAEYDVDADFKARFVRQESYYTIGDAIQFEPFVPYECLGSDVAACIRKLLTEAVRKRLMGDRRIGCMLSGGLDSSLIAALLVRLAKEHNLPYKIQSFAIGMDASPDLIAAKQVADYIGTEHHEVRFTERDVREHLDGMLYAIESPDITTARASIGMYLISKYIRENTKTTVVFSGEGADELAQGYIYFRDAPDADAAHAESLKLLGDIYMFDGLRADRTTAAHSLELRCPFLDLQFTSYYLNLPKSARQPRDNVEKYLLRSAFESENLLPAHILWRHKEAFSDGVAAKKKSLFMITQEIADEHVTDLEVSEAKRKYPVNTPRTKEALYYRDVFERHFPGLVHMVPYYWMPKWTDATDPSARFISHYAAED